MECQVKFSDLKLKEAFENLKESDERLYKEIDRALGEISNNGFYGRQVKFSNDK